MHANTLRRVASLRTAETVGIVAAALVSILTVRYVGTAVGPTKLIETDTMSTHPDSGATAITRRTALKAGATAVGVAAISATPKIEPVAATDSGEPELTVTATIPQESTVQVTVEEYSEEDGDLENNESTEIEDGTNSYILDSLNGEDWYGFEIELGTDDESPSLDSLTLEIPVESDEDEDEDDQDGDDDLPITIFGIEIPSFDDLWPFGGDGDNEDGDDGGWFDFDFWPFGADDDEEENGDDDHG